MTALTHLKTGDFVDCLGLLRDLLEEDSVESWPRVAAELCTVLDLFGQHLFELLGFGGRLACEFAEDQEGVVCDFDVSFRELGPGSEGSCGCRA